MKLRTDHPDADSGFTLLEILVGLAISSLVMVGLSLSMKTINQGFDQATVSIGRQATISTGLYVIAGDISRIERAIDDPDKPAQYLFLGNQSEAVYVLAERPGNNRAGLYWVRLLVRATKAGAELVRMRAPFIAGKNDIAAIEWTDEVVLLRGEISIQLSYRAPRLGLRQWASGWQTRNVLPTQIKIEVTDLKTGRLRVPVFVQTLKIDASFVGAMLTDAHSMVIAESIIRLGHHLDLHVVAALRALHVVQVAQPLALLGLLPGLALLLPREPSDASGLQKLLLVAAEPVVFARTVALVQGQGLRAARKRRRENG